jgi:nitrate reductase gamma subunit
VGLPRSEFNLSTMGRHFLTSISSTGRALILLIGIGLRRWAIWLFLEQSIFLSVASELRSQSSRWRWCLFLEFLFDFGLTVILIGFRVFFLSKFGLVVKALQVADGFNLLKRGVAQRLL